MCSGRSQKRLERVKGIEPSSSAWKASKIAIETIVRWTCSPFVPVLNRLRNPVCPLVGTPGTSGSATLEKFFRAGRVLKLKVGLYPAPGSPRLSACARIGAVLAQRLRERWDRRLASERCARPFAAEAALRVAGPCFAHRSPTERTGAGPPRRRDRSSRGRHDLQIAALQDQGAAKKRGFRWRRPRHTLKGRQIADEIDRVGLRLKLRKAQAEAGGILDVHGCEPTCKARTKTFYLFYCPPPSLLALQP